MSWTKPKVNRPKTHEFHRVIDDPNSPERLRGKTVTGVVDEVANRMNFLIDMPDDPTPNEIGYFKWFVGEFTDKLSESSGVGMTRRDG